jgi:hypothetical protein
MDDGTISQYQQKIMTLAATQEKPGTLYTLTSEGGFTGSGDIQRAVFKSAGGARWIDARTMTSFVSVDTSTLQAFEKIVPKLTSLNSRRDTGFDAITYRLQVQNIAADGGITSTLLVQYDNFVAKPTDKTFLDVMKAFRNLRSPAP